MTLVETSYYIILAIFMAKKARLKAIALLITK